MTDVVEPNDPMDDLINVALVELANAGIDPDQIGINTFMLDLQFKSLMKALISTGVVTEELLQTTFKQHYLETLQELIVNVAPQVRQARLAAMIAPTNGITDQFGRLIPKRNG